MPLSIPPLQRTLLVRLLQLVVAVMLLWLGVYVGLNNHRLGTLISNIVNRKVAVRGQFKLAYAHYDYWSGLGSIIFNVPAPVSARDYELIDPDGALVLKIPEVHADMYIGELIRGLIRTAFAVPFKRGSFVELHFARGQIQGGQAHIAATASSLREHPDRPDWNLVAAMTSRKLPTETEGPGYLHILVDGDGLALNGLSLDLDMARFRTRIEGLSGIATLRFSSAAKETRPGRPGFVYEVSPLTAGGGELLVRLKEGEEPLLFPLADIHLRRLGARASQRQNLSFRGRARFAGAAVELDGQLTDTYCDPGVDVQLSFEQGGEALSRLTAGLLFGPIQGRGRIRGPFSEPLPTTPAGDPAPCLAVRASPYLRGPDGRALVIEGDLAQVEAEAAEVRLSQGRSKFRLARNVLTLPSATGALLDGQAQAEGMRVVLGQPIQVAAQLKWHGLDPAQVRLLSPALRRLTGGKLSGAARFAGLWDQQSKYQRLRLTSVDASLERRHGDAFPRDLSLRGDITYTPTETALRDIALEGQGLSMTLPQGSVSLPSGRLKMERIDIKGNERAGRVLQALGVEGAAVKDVAASLKLLGRVRSPEIEQGAFSVHGLDLYGRHLDALSSGFTLHDGTLTLQGLEAQGVLGGGSASAGRVALQLFRGDTDHLLADPPLRAGAELRRVSAAQLLQNPKVDGTVSARVELAGNLRRPTGTASIEAPVLSVYGAQLHRTTLDLQLEPDRYLLNSLFAVLGPPAPGPERVLSGSGQLGREGAMPVVLQLNPSHLRLRDIPLLGRLRYRFNGELSGSVRIDGTMRPLSPNLTGQLALDDFTVSGQPLVLSTPLDEPAETEPLFRLLGVAVQTLSLNRADLSFSSQGGGTRITGNLFGAFRVDGLVYLNPAHLHGEITIGFGCPPGAAPGAGQGADCDLQAERLVPELGQLGDLEVHSRLSGELRLRFGHPLPPPPQSSEPLPLRAELRLFRAAFALRAFGDDGTEQRYRLWHGGDLLLATDLDSISVERVVLLSRRLRAGEPDLPPGFAGEGGQPGLPLIGELAAHGWIGAAKSDLRLTGRVSLELLEHLLPSTFKKTAGELAADVHLVGPRDRLALVGALDLRGASFTPYDLDTPFNVPAAHLDLTPQRATLRDLAVVSEGNSARAGGSVEVKGLFPLALGQLSLTASGLLSARLLQWALPRSLSETRGALVLRDLRVTGTLAAPRLDGTLVIRDVFFNIRRFHEVQLHRGTLRFAAEAGSAPASIRVGCGAQHKPGECEDLEGRVDSDGRIRMSGTVLYAGLGRLLRGPWYDPLERVRLYLDLENIRHGVAGVYNVEISAPQLMLSGDRDHLVLAGVNGPGLIDVVSGRYTQPFDIKELILSQRVVEEEEPFWRSDPYLARLELNLKIFTRGNFLAHNNIFDLRMSTQSLTVMGPLDGLRFGGTVRVDGGTFSVPGLRGDFSVKGDSKIDFTPREVWPDNAYIDVRGSNVLFDPSEQARNVELALRGRPSELKIECISSDGLNAGDCMSYLLLGGTSDQVRRYLSGDPSAGPSPRVLSYSDTASRMVLSPLLSQQVEQPLREKLRLDTVRIQFGVSSFSLQVCPYFRLYTRICGRAEWGLLASTSARYQAYGELRLADWAFGQVSFDRLERGFEQIEDTIDRFKVQVGVRLPLLY